MNTKSRTEMSLFVTSGKPGTQTGFTLIELMIVVAIVGVLTAVAFPSFQQAYYNQQVKTTVSDAHIALLLARSEAIKRNANVEIYGIAGGWEVRQSDGTVLQTKNDLPTNMTVDCNTDANDDAEDCPSIIDSNDPNVTYKRTGRVDSFIEFRFYIAANNNVVMRCLTTSLSGRPYVVVDSDNDKTNGCN